jgi:uncharacterized membrane protein YecN with MAPEG domain
MPLPYTSIFAGLLALWLIYLQFSVIRFRLGKQVLLGDGGDAHGERLIRGHANAVETVPIFLILLALSEGLGTPGWVIALLGALFLLGRVLHGAHFITASEDLTLRRTGMQLTLLATLATALGLIGHAVVAL